ncbi:hypothetical protein [Burkholderia ubonensis]|uniref:hypothetical protein n=1 Tax=Burkholderia ubonensis TaxID=101571 RepID=UPI002AB0F626|nr:hypothetical protein [Burkholderia ubonensis]
MTQRWYTSSSGSIEFWLYEADARFGYHPGQCDASIAGLRQQPCIAKQLAMIDPAALRAELREYGAWDDVQLTDHNENLSRILWLACGDIVENMGD